MGTEAEAVSATGEANSESLRVAVLAHALNSAGGLSVGSNLTAALARTAPANRYLFVVPDMPEYDPCRTAPNASTYTYRRRGGQLGRWWFDEFQLPRIVGGFRPHVVLALGNRGLTSPPCPQAVLCHDPHLFYPEKHFARETLPRKWLKRYQKRRLARDLKQTQLLLCQTPVAEARLRSTFQYTGRAALCPNAVSTAALSGTASLEEPQALAPYRDRIKLFCLTRYYPHKNLELIVELFSKYGHQLADYVAVFTIEADQHCLARRLLAQIQGQGLDRFIVNVGPLEQRDLAAYYTHCDALLLPTTLESFSGTYLEAQQFGCPILTSDLDFAREVCGEEASYFDPWRIDSLREALLRLDGWARRSSGKGKGCRINPVDWDRIAEGVGPELSTIASIEGRFTGTA